MDTKTEEMAVQIWGFKMVLKNPGWKSMVIFVVLLAFLLLIIYLLNGLEFRKEILQ